jgi:signal transduction histidine kinase
VESILFYSGLQSGASKAPAMSDIDLHSFLDDVISPLQQLAAEKGSTLRLSADSIPGAMRSDPTALRLVLENLVMNAVRHADTGEIRVTVTRKVFDLISIAVEDEGPGIPAREQAHVFAPFARGERSIKGQRPGSGLGLHLVERVCAMLGGEVKLESPYLDIAETAHRGCRFTVLIPFIETRDG